MEGASSAINFQVICLSQPSFMPSESIFWGKLKLWFAIEILWGFLFFISFLIAIFWLIYENMVSFIFVFEDLFGILWDVSVCYSNSNFGIKMFVSISTYYLKIFFDKQIPFEITWRKETRLENLLMRFGVIGSNEAMKNEAKHCSDCHLCDVINSTSMVDLHDKI